MSSEGFVEPTRTNWLSCGRETLVHNRPWTSDPALRSEGEYNFDVFIVGSGHGGAVTAAELSGCTDERGQRLSICVLELGREYLAGAFPSRQAEVTGHVRFATPNSPRQRGVHGGVYDIRWSADAVAVVASGLGGRSLMLVMERVRQVQKAPARDRFECVLFRPWCFRGQL
jgi:choline dehydrogenase-like flavoprotein